MSNSFQIPPEVEDRIRRRDKKCVYCKVKVVYPWDKKNRGKSATVEHFRENGPFYWGEGLKEKDLAKCCGSCNSSRGRLPLLEWFKKEYCTEKNINEKTVEKPVRDYLKANCMENKAIVNKYDKS